MIPNFSLRLDAFFVTFLASFLLWFMFALLIVLWMMKKGVKRQHVVHAVVASFFAWGATEIIKSLFPTLRPFQAQNINPLTITIPTDASFPSAHAASSFALATSIRKNGKLGFAFIVGAIFVSAGRVLGNVHYVADILAGALIGILAAITVEKGNINLKKFFKA